MSTTSPPVPARIEQLDPYSCARNIIKGKRWTFLDANESPMSLITSQTSMDDINRYPDPTADELRKKIGDFYGVPMDQIIISNGCDELISLCVQAFVRPSYGVLSVEPTYGMYRVCAETYGASYKAVQMEEEFSLDIQKLRTRFERTDVLFLCTPNNPTGNILPQSVLELVIDEFSGLIVIDEAYGEFADEEGISSCIEYVKKEAKNVIVLRTFSKAFGAAGIRLGYGIADRQIIEQLLKVKMPYNVNMLTQNLGLALWEKRECMKANVRFLKEERQYLEKQFMDLGFTVSQSITNFFLLKSPDEIDSNELCRALKDSFGIVVRNFGDKPLLKNTLRITVGTRQENDRLLSAISSLV
ncbi:histidinol-phosphate transaminase [Patescibacteria group bacterium]|nr:histidinol-phosphate transaminase [Patescibacteria group bacterium]